jgi:SMC interacting uncharacterized protein involved in chromosome segregation
LAFIVFSLSCVTTRLKEVKTSADWQGKKVKILAVDKTSGEHIEFSKKNLGRIYGDKIAGTAVVLSKKVEITQDNIKKVTKDIKGMISEITHKNGKIYHVVNGTVRVVSTKGDLTGKEEDRIIFFTTYETSASVTIPLSEVKSVQVKKFDYAKSLCLVGAIGLAFFLGFAVAMSRIDFLN